MISAGMCRQVITTVEYTCFCVISISWLHSIEGFLQKRKNRINKENGGKGDSS